MSKKIAEAKRPAIAMAPTAMPALAPVDIGAAAGSGVGVLDAADGVALVEGLESDSAVPVGVLALALVLELEVLVVAAAEVKATTALLLVELGCPTSSHTP
jgi:hypothetical protein